MHRQTSEPSTPPSDDDDGAQLADHDVEMGPPTEQDVDMTAMPPGSEDTGLEAMLQSMVPSDVGARQASSSQPPPADGMRDADHLSQLSDLTALPDEYADDERERSPQPPPAKKQRLGQAMPTLGPAAALFGSANEPVRRSARRAPGFAHLPDASDLHATGMPSGSKGRGKQRQTVQADRKGKGKAVDSEST
ncbi:uncharacterized protein PHACADRAFT_34034 [Phanerochaete carnosa HHB-10118-sp]|uniref:Uncharacterized protein n=1 Tax=Phanerochaete carnosa (strain HHB-10118-sp) TaxID=650164 RepID=K5WCZ7_PHACS|nr:uncharacterized protein PHACADRAFT_34034 [Phanerochaete carnosa HHB-10118-sp]EKM48062.1 hypothetical protein PHACADRAFT_34034 [Phanerochaete carnosa HHB-10118-sp]